MCEKVCPNNNPVDKVQPQKWYQGWVCKTREQSSSGGAAAGLTQNFIQNGGYVAACLFRDGEFVFDITNDLDYARKFAGSKYVKSNPKNIYSKIHERLKQGDRVLFIGLPCQVAALNNYIKDKKNLYTVDLICHGSPSPIILEKYLAENYVDIKKIKDLNFRNKDGFGLRSGYKRISFDDGSDLYTFAFLTSLDYTENCYSCRYATLDRVSDITLGDSWGSELEAEEQKKGISLILCQTEKGKELLGSPFAQFLKMTSEIRCLFKVGEKQHIATRLMGGVLYAYGNQTVAPYSEQFYIGGANSIRAFTVRSIGPGTFHPNADNRYGYIDETGDVKLEANIEYRFPILGDLYGATFLDAGNVWLMKKDEARPGGELTMRNFAKSVALGTGVGLRYDLTFLVIRLDLGIALHAPYDTGKSGYYNIPKFKDGLGLHFAIGYPF